MPFLNSNIQKLRLRKFSDSKKMVLVVHNRYTKLEALRVTIIFYNWNFFFFFFGNFESRNAEINHQAIFLTLVILVKMSVFLFKVEVCYSWMYRWFFQENYIPELCDE